MTVIACDVAALSSCPSGFCRNQRIGTVAQCRQFFCKKRNLHLSCHVRLTELVIRQVIAEFYVCIFYSCFLYIAFTVHNNVLRQLPCLHIAASVPEPLVVVTLCIQYDCHLTGALVASGVEYNKRNCVFAIFFKCRSICQVCNISGSILGKGMGNLCGTVETDFDFFVDLIHTAAANAVVGMVLHQDLPCIVETVMGIFLTVFCCKYSQRLGYALQCNLVSAVLAL